MKLIIDIDESLLEGIKSDDFDFARRVVKNFQGTIASAIANGTPIPDNATNGEVMRAIFSDGVKTSIAYPRDVSKEWINAPYQKGGKE